MYSVQELDMYINQALSMLPMGEKRTSLVDTDLFQRSALAVITLVVVKRTSATMLGVMSNKHSRHVEEASRNLTLNKLVGLDLVIAVQSTINKSFVVSLTIAKTI